ncbi:hypothetical protein FQA39_LY19118 [Lamprigera yunnana]|nr:hypothetical protein FQA39_LY19118 [Lamprigera yunnana]
MWAFIFAIVLVILFISYFKKKNRYWYYKKVHAPQPTIFLGNIQDIIKKKKPGFGYINELYTKYKSQGIKYFGVYVFTIPVFIVIDPDIIKRLLQTDFQYFTDRPTYLNEENEPLAGHLSRLKGSKWKTMRTKLTPTFTAGKMKMMFHTMLECSYSLENVVDGLAKTNAPIDIRGVLNRFGTDVIVSCGLGLECNTLEDKNSQFRYISDLIIDRSRLQLFKEIFFYNFPWIADFLKVRTFDDKFTNFFVKLITETIDYRETNNVVRKDFMHLLIQMKENYQLGKETSTDPSFTLTINEIIAQVIQFLFAGLETSSSALTFCFYELGLNQDIQSKLRNEIITVLAKHDGEITYEALMEMSYMDMCIKETLRKYPTLFSLSRSCTQTYKLPNSDVTIDKGTMLIIPMLLIHMDEDYYPSPNTFNPDRFLSSENNFTWLSFGEGPRHCIGIRFGMMQMKMTLITLLRNFKISLHEDTEIPLSLSLYGVIKPKSTVYLTAEKLN